MAEHQCTVCFATIGAPSWRGNHHDDQCPVEHDYSHFPPLCCPGCGCLSFEEAHPDYVVLCTCGAKIEMLLAPLVGPVWDAWVHKATRSPVCYGGAEGDEMRAEFYEVVHRDA